MNIWFGVIEDISTDPFRVCRYKVRVVGVHNPLKSELSTEDLPWATPLLNNSPAMSGIGESATGYLQGSTVAVVFLDEDLQIPLILGSIGGVPGNMDYTGSELFNGIESDLSIIPPAAPKDDIVKLPDGTIKSSKDYGTIPTNAIVTEQGYIGPLTASDVRRLIPHLASLRGDDAECDTVFGLGKYQHTLNELNLLGYISDAGTWTGLNNVSSKESILGNSQLQYDIEEELLKLNYTGLAKLGIISSSTPKEKVAGLLLSAQVDGAFASYKLLNDSVDTTNSIGDSVLSFYNNGYRLINGKVTTEQPTSSNINEVASDKYETDTSTSKSKYDVKHTNKSEKNQGFRDPDNKFPLKDHLNESDTPRLATGYKIDSTIVGFKETVAIKSVSVANSSVKWKQSPIPYNAQYPYNKVFQSVSGHVMEFDDTPGSERVNIHHRAGTFWEVDNAGNSVDRTMGIRTIIVDKDELVYIKGSGHVTIDGDLSIKVNNALQIEVSGDANFKVNGNASYDINGDFNVKASGDVNIDGANIHFNSGMAQSISQFSPTINTPAPVTRKEQQAIELEDMTASQLLANLKQVAPVTQEEFDSTQPTASLTAVKSVNALPTEIGYDTQLTTNYKIRNLAVGSLGSNFPFKGQHNLSANDIANNLKALCLNCLEPLRAKYVSKGFKLNSVIRPGGNPSSIPGKISQHELGQAADISFSHVRGQPNDREQFYEIATWIRDNILFDQLLLEYRDMGRQVWIHISFNEKGNRREVKTVNNDKVYKNGLVLLI